MVSKVIVFDLNSIYQSMCEMFMNIISSTLTLDEYRRKILLSYHNSGRHGRMDGAVVAIRARSVESKTVCAASV